jgi:hypothetical protein
MTLARPIRLCLGYRETRERRAALETAGIQARQTIKPK